MTPAEGNRRVLHGTCRRCREAAGFANLLVTKEPGGVVFDPHVTGACVICLDQAAARELHQALGEWLT